MELKVIGRIFILLVLFLAINFLAPIKSVTQETPPASFIKEAKALYNIEEDYFQKRIKSDWKALYDYQHPDYRNKVTFEEFEYFDGRAVIDYAKTSPLHVSGAPGAGLELIKKGMVKRDMLGYPVERKYRMFNDPLSVMKTYSIEKISISKNGKYAKAHYKADMESVLPPAIVRGHIPYKLNLAGEDYWEKIDGKWYITVLKKKLTISGVQTGHYYIPNNDDAWEKMEFVEIEASSLLSIKTAKELSNKTQN